MSSLNNIDKKYNIVIYASFIILAIGLIYVMNKQNNLTNKQNDLSSLITTGPGSNTVKIPSTGGLYYYSPAICYLYATKLLTNGYIQWDMADPNNVPTKGFTIGNNDGAGANTTIIPNVYGYYEITISGTVTPTGSVYLAMNNINVKFFNIYFQAVTSAGNGITISTTQFARPYTTNNLSGFNFQLTNATLWDGGEKLYACVKFIGF